MVMTRGARNPQRSADDAENAGVNRQEQESPTMFHSDSDDDYVLGQAEKPRKRRAKRRRVGKKKRKIATGPSTRLATRPPIEVLPTEVLQLVFLFLDNARDIYNLANKFGNKHLRAAALDPEIIIRAAVFTDRHTRESMAEVMAMVKARSIHIPSDQRLLRLANAIMCERGQDCYGYSLVNKVPAVLPQYHYYGLRPFGLCICSQCLDVMSPSNLMPSGWNRDNDNGMVCSRLAKTYGSQVLCQPHVETATGEPVGPLLLGKQIKQIVNTYHNQEERTNAFDALLQQIDQDAPDDQEARIEMLVNAHSKAESDYEAFELAKEQAEKAKKQAVLDELKSKRALRAAKKVKNMRRVYTALSGMLEDFAHKDIALACEWQEDSDHPSCTFTYGPSMAILQGLVSAPSSATKKKIGTAAASVREMYSLLSSNGFLETNFMVFPKNSNESRPADTVLHQYCLQQLSWKSLLRKYSHLVYHYRQEDNVWTGNFLSYLQKAQPIEALAELLEESDMRNAFVLHAVTEQDQEAHDKFPSLATCIWNRSYDRAGLDDMNALGEFRTRFDGCFAVYGTAAANLRDYLAEPAPIAFLAETGPPLHNPLQSFTRQHAVNKTFEDLRGEDLLSDRDFPGLLALHRRIFQNPYEFGYSVRP